jgi:hypothetical protein
LRPEPVEKCVRVDEQLAWFSHRLTDRHAPQRAPDKPGTPLAKLE